MVEGFRWKQGSMHQNHKVQDQTHCNDKPVCYQKKKKKVVNVNKSDEKFGMEKEKGDWADFNSNREISLIIQDRLILCICARV